MSNFLYYDDDTGDALYTLKTDSISDLPAGSKIDIPDDFDMELIGLKVVDGEIVRDDILPKQQSAISEINNSVGTVRSALVTVIPAQDMIYLKKEDEARRYLADPDPEIDDFPFIAAEVGITAPDAYQVAQTYINLAYILRDQAAGLENFRLGFIGQVENASTDEAIDLIMDHFRTMLGEITP